MPNFRAFNKFGCTYSKDYAAAIRGQCHESSDCFEHPQKIPLNSSHQKKYLATFPTQKNPRIENCKPPKNFYHPRHLRSRVPPWDFTALPPISLSLCIHLSSVRLTKGLGKWEFHSSLTDSFWYAIYSLTVKQDRCLPKSFVIVFEKRFFSIFQETDCSCAVTNYRTDGPNVNFTFHSFS